MATIKITTEAALEDLVSKCPTIGIIGYPGAGKTTLANALGDGRQVIHTDDFLDGVSHEDRPAKILEALQSPYIVEGNEVTRLITRGLALDLLLLVVGSERLEKQTAGLRGRVDKFLREYEGNIRIYHIRPRELKKKS